MGIKVRTTTSFCATKDGVAYTGSKEDVVLAICKFRTSEQRQLTYQIKGFKERTVFSYGEKYTEDEMYQDIIRVLWDKLDSHGWMTYKRGWSC